MKVLKSTLLLLAFLAITFHADAQRDLYNWQITPSAGISYYGKNWDLPTTTNNYMYGLRLERRLGSAFTLGFNVARINLSDGELIDELTFGAINLGFHWDNGFLLSERSWFSLFHRLEYGYADDAENLSDLRRSKNEPTLGLENGIKIRFGQRISAELAVEILATRDAVFDGDIDDARRIHNFKAGISYHFGERQSHYRAPVFLAKSDYDLPPKEKLPTVGLTNVDTLGVAKAPLISERSKSPTLNTSSSSSQSRAKTISSADSLRIFMHFDSLYVRRKANPYSGRNLQPGGISNSTQVDSLSIIRMDSIQSKKAQTVGDSLDPTLQGRINQVESLNQVQSVDSTQLEFKSDSALAPSSQKAGAMVDSLKQMLAPLQLSDSLKSKNAGASQDVRMKGSADSSATKKSINSQDANGNPPSKDTIAKDTLRESTPGISRKDTLQGVIESTPEQSDSVKIKQAKSEFRDNDKIQDVKERTEQINVSDPKMKNDSKTDSDTLRSETIKVPVKNGQAALDMDDERGKSEVPSDKKDSNKFSSDSAELEKGNSDTKRKEDNSVILERERSYSSTTEELSRDDAKRKSTSVNSGKTETEKDGGTINSSDKSDDNQSTVSQERRDESETNKDRGENRNQSNVTVNESDRSNPNKNRKDDSGNSSDVDDKRSDSPETIDDQKKKNRDTSLRTNSETEIVERNKEEDSKPAKIQTLDSNESNVVAQTKRDDEQNELLRKQNALLEKSIESNERIAREQRRDSRNDNIGALAGGATLGAIATSGSNENDTSIGVDTVFVTEKDSIIQDSLNYVIDSLQRKYDYITGETNYDINDTANLNLEEYQNPFKTSDDQTNSLKSERGMAKELSDSSSGEERVIEKEQDGNDGNTENLQNDNPLDSNKESSKSLADEKVSAVSNTSGKTTMKAIYPTVLIFEANNAKLTDTDKSILSDVVTDLENNTSRNVYLRGYSDKTSDAPDNVELSQNRVASVKQYFTDRSIDAARIRIEVDGSSADIGMETAGGRVVIDLR